MAKRFTDTNKWSDIWFMDLSKEGKLLFLFMLDHCDTAGFYELNKKLVGYMIGIDKVEGVLKELEERLIIKDNWIWIKNFIRHQKNLPINSLNNAHKSIIKCIEDKMDMFPEAYKYLQINLLNDSPKQAPKGAQGAQGARQPQARGTGKGNSNSKGKVIISKEYEKIIFGFYDTQFKYHPKQLKDWEGGNDKMVFEASEVLGKLIRIDGYSIEEIKDALRFALKDEFWRDQVLSLSGLRKKSASNGLTKFANIFTRMSKDTKVDITVFRDDTTGNSKIGYCSVCGTNDFYSPKTVMTDDSKCRNHKGKVLPEKPIKVGKGEETRGTVGAGA